MSVLGERPNLRDDASLSMEPEVEHRNNGAAVARATPDSIHPSAPVEASGAHVMQMTRGLPCLHSRCSVLTPAGSGASRGYGFGCVARGCDHLRQDQLIV